MGQKVHPYGFRLGVIKTWNSKWFEDKSYAKWLHEDIRVKRAVKEYLQNAGIAAQKFYLIRSFRRFVCEKKLIYINTSAGEKCE